jgi:hypothetical protein
VMAPPYPDPITTTSYLLCRCSHGVPSMYAPVAGYATPNNCLK